MRVRFNGMFVNKTSRDGGGCACHKATSGGRMFQTHRSLILPSGAFMDFHVGEEYIVSDLDGNFLLSYSQTDKDGVRQDAFTRID